MARQIPSIPTSKSISDLIGMINRGELILQPEFQRRLVWNSSHKEAFIDTILSGYPFPEIYIAQSGVDIETLQSQQVVVDGQQRLTAIKQYIEGHEDFGKNVIPFHDLDSDEKKDFLRYNVVIRDLQDASSETIKEIFRRINQTKFNLLQIEIQNAIYDGEFISTAKEIIEILSENGIPVFSETEISRMGDLNFILLVMSTIEEGGYFAGNKKIEDYIIEYNNKYENKDNIKRKIIDTINLIDHLELSDDSIWFRKSNYFTLVCELIKAGNIVQLKDKLLSFEKNIILDKGKPDSDFNIYYSYMYSGTNSRTARVERGRIFNKYIN